MEGLQQPRPQGSGLCNRESLTRVGPAQSSSFLRTSGDESGELPLLQTRNLCSEGAKPSRQEPQNCPNPAPALTSSALGLGILFAYFWVDFSQCHNCEKSPGEAGVEAEEEAGEESGEGWTAAPEDPGDLASQAGV